MKNKFFNYTAYCILVLSLICLILYGSILRHHYKGGKKFPSLQKIAVFFAEIPSNIKFILGSAENIPLDNKSVNKVIAINSIHHWKDYKKGLLEVHRVLKSKGFGFRIIQANKLKIILSSKAELIVDKLFLNHRYFLLV